MLPQFSGSAMLTDVLDPRRQREKPKPRRKRGKKPSYHQYVSLATTIPRISRPSVPQPRCYGNGAYCLVTGIKNVKRHGRIEPVRIDDFDELDVFEEFVTALFRTNTDRRQKAINDKLWEFVILL